jgi:arylsulfatase A-like enzyme
MEPMPTEEPRRLRRAGPRLALGCLLAAFGCADAPPPAGPNVVLITFDGLRQDHLAVFGYERETAPNISWLAKNGVALRDVVPTSCATKISLTSLFTSLDYPSHGVSGLRSDLEDDHRTLAEVFADHGYTTGGFVGSPWITADMNYDQGFDVYEDFRDRRARMPSAHVVVKKALDFLGSEGIEDDRPFFLYVHLKEPHPPWKHGSPWLKGRERSKRPFDEGCTYIPEDEVFAAVSPEKRRSLIDLYDGAIKYADDRIGDLLATLRSLHVMHRTVIAVSTDHGLELLDRYSASHGYTPFDEVLRGFLVLYDGRGALDGSSAAGFQTRIFDIGPTLLGLAGLPVPEGLDGVDLLREPERLPEFAFSTCYAGDVVRSRRHKLVHLASGRLERRHRPPALQGEWRLFDLEADPAELRDVRAEQPEVFAVMRQALASYGGEPEAAQLTEEEVRAMDRNTVERLRAMGYVE